MTPILAPPFAAAAVQPITTSPMRRGGPVALPGHFSVQSDNTATAIVARQTAISMPGGIVFPGQTERL
jgi:hypothetical protein